MHFLIHSQFTAILQHPYSYPCNVFRVVKSTVGSPVVGHPQLFKHDCQLGLVPRNLREQASHISELGSVPSLFNLTRCKINRCRCEVPHTTFMLPVGGSLTISLQSTLLRQTLIFIVETVYRSLSRLRTISRASHHDKHQLKMCQRWQRWKSWSSKV